MANIIFDFDGTMADSFSMVVKMVTRWKSAGKQVNIQEIERLRNMPMNKILREFRIPPWRVPAMIVRGRFEMGRQIDQLKAFEGIPEIIKQLNESGNSLYILSTNSRRNIRKFLRQAGMDDCFKRIYGSVGLFGKAKALKRLVRANRLNIEDTFYVGDEVRDIRAAKKANIKIISVSWGFNGHNLLEEEGPFVVVDKPLDLLKVLET